MSYEKCKSITLKPKTNQIFLSVASNNITPLYYERFEYASKLNCSLEDKLMYLMISMLDGNIQISQLNKNTIKFEYALLKVREYNRQNENIDKYDKRYELFEKELSKYVDINNREKRFAFVKENSKLVNEIERKINKELYKEEFKIFKTSIEEKIEGKYYLKNDFGKIYEFVRETSRGYRYRVYEEPTADCLMDYKLAYIRKNIMGKDFEIEKYQEVQENKIELEDEEEEYEE